VIAPRCSFQGLAIILNAFVVLVYSFKLENVELTLCAAFEK